MHKFIRSLPFSLFLFAIAVAACAPAATPVPPTHPVAPPTRTAIATPAITATSQPTLPPSQTTAPLGVTGSMLVAHTNCAPDEFDSQCAYAQDQILSIGIGSRVAGTPNGERAGDYMADQFKSFGYSVDKQEFTFEPWEDLGTKVVLTLPESRELEAIPIQFSGAGHLEAELVAVSGAGEPSDFAKVNVKGKIAFIQRGTLQFYDKSKNAADAGAAAAIIYNNAPQLFGGTMREHSTIPALAMSGRESDKILSALSQGAVKIKIDSDTQLTKKVSHNIVATKPGTNGKTLILGGHYDTVAAGPGADDNGSGAAVLIELARVMAKRDMKYSLVFIGFDAEEYGLVGSRYYVDHLSESDRGKITAMFNFDMLAGGKGPLGLGGDGAVAQLARDDAMALGIPAENSKLPNSAGSDHQSFARIGIDTLYFSRNDYALLHTPQDTIDQVHPDWLGEAGRVALRALMDLNSR